jgi:hypothetical protein
MSGRLHTDHGIHQGRPPHHHQHVRSEQGRQAAWQGQKGGACEAWRWWVVSSSWPQHPLQFPQPPLQFSQYPLQFPQSPLQFRQAGCTLRLTAPDSPSACSRCTDLHETKEGLLCHGAPTILSLRTQSSLAARAGECFADRSTSAKLPLLQYSVTTQGGTGQTPMKASTLGCRSVASSPASCKIWHGEYTYTLVLPPLHPGAGLVIMTNDAVLAHALPPTLLIYMAFLE